MGPESTSLEDKVDVFGMTHVGRVRHENQDQFLLCTLRKQMEVFSTSLPEPERLPLRGEMLAYLALVADGVGGAAAGADASRKAVETVVQFVNLGMRTFHIADSGEDEAFQKYLRDAVAECQTAVLAHAAEAGHECMATTLTMLIALWPRAYVVQVGDSRCYWLRKGKLTQITRDQTLAQELIERGELTEGDEDAQRLGNVLVSAIGAQKAEPAITRLVLRRGDVVLLCSDGLTGGVPDDLIRKRLLEMDSAEQACQDLIDDALAAGGKDNITVLVGRLRPA
jgi:PPM family protein phosphatase